MQADLVLEGGGVKGIGLVGAIMRLEQGFTFERIAGTSVGALVGALVAAGYSGDELEEELLRFPFRQVPRPDRLDRVPIIGPALSITFERGVWETTFVRDHLAELLAAKGVETFADLRLRDKKSSLPREKQFKLVVTASDVTTGELLYLPWDYGVQFGLEPEEQRVADAVAASIAIPFFFEPIEIADDEGHDHLLVDGGLLSNYPISVFDRTDGAAPRWPTFGIKIIPELPAGTSQLFPFAAWLRLPGLRHLGDVIATAIVGRDQTFLSQPCVRARTMQVETGAAGVVEFDLGLDQKRELCDEGRKAAEEFLAGWDWEAYLERCRPTR